MSTVTDSIELSACVDCVAHIAGITPAEQGHEYPEAVTSALSRITRDNGGAHVQLVNGGECMHPVLHADTGCECAQLGFSWSRCEVCLSPLGGDRETVTLLLSA